MHGFVKIKNSPFIRIGQKRANNAPLQLAKKTKNDEFYTKYEDIEKELPYYWGQLKGKVIYCNCDSPESNFVKYFINNFHAIGMKKLIATHYIKDDMVSTAVKPQKLIMTKGGTTLSRLRGDGDFRSEECIDILSECDMVITNPPFSLLKHYIPMILCRRFLIICPITVFSASYLRPHILSGSVWAGVDWRAKRFYTPNGDARFGVSWITNMAVPEKEWLPLTVKYSKDKYPRYDNYDAIDAGCVQHIPMDYYSNIGVPISYLLKHNDKQFHLVGMSAKCKIASKNVFYRCIIKRTKNKK